MNNLIQQAKMFSMVAHDSIGQRRKYTNLPYYIHPQEVVNILYENIPDIIDTEMICAAYLHDIIEDTKIQYCMIEYYFGNEVTNLVRGLTSITKDNIDNRKTRKQIDRIFLSEQCSKVQNIKLADLISNSRSIIENDPKFSKVYMEEVDLLNKILIRADIRLTKILQEIIDNYKTGVYHG